MRAQTPFLAPLVFFALIAAPACDGKVEGVEDTSATDACLPERLQLSNADATWTGEGGKDHMGETVVGGFDLSADGTPDLVTSSSTAADNGTFSGKVSVAYGPAEDGISLGDATATITGADAYSYFGSAVWVQDFNHDGYAELLLGARGANDDDGAAYVFFGPTEGDLSTADADATFEDGYEQAYAGTSVAGGDDFDLDGNGDMALGAPGLDVVVTYKGAISPENYELTDYYNYFYGEQEGDGVGTQLAVADLDGDGSGDMVVGAPEYYRAGTRIGKVYTIYAPFDYGKGNALDLSDIESGIVGTDLNNRPSVDIAVPGDVNGDGYGDLFIGAEYGVTNTGEVGGSNEGAGMLFYGPVKTERTTEQADATLIGEAADDHAGTNVAAPGDVNGDDEVDVLVGAPGNDTTGTDAGRAYLLFGPLTGTTVLDKADVILEGDAAEDNAGRDVAGAGDMNGDSYPDLLVGSPGDPSTNSPGTVALINGCGL